MKKIYFHIHIFSFFFLLAFITSCNGQEKTTLSKTDERKVDHFFDLNLDSDKQIAEYIRNIFQDKNGSLWFGTNNYGVAHFNGDSIYYFSNAQGFSGRQIKGITEDQEKNIWFATDQGIVKYDWSTTKTGENIFTNFTDQDKSVWSIFADSKGVIWAGTTEGVFRFEGTKLKSFDLPYSKEKTGDFFTNRTIWSISEDRKGNLWFGTNGNGAFRYDGNTFIQYTEKDGLTDNSVDNILEDTNGNIWFGTRYGGVSMFDGKTFVNYTTKNHIGNNEVCIIYEDKIGNVWFSSEGYGVYRYNGKSFTNFSIEQGLEVKAVQTIFEDKEGRFWVGGGGGLFQFNGTSFINIKKNGPWK